MTTRRIKVCQDCGVQFVALYDNAKVCDLCLKIRVQKHLEMNAERRAKRTKAEYHELVNECEVYDKPETVSAMIERENEG